MKSNQVLHLGEVSLMQQYRLGTNQLEDISAKRNRQLNMYQGTLAATKAYCLGCA